MRISLSWLRDYVDAPADPDVLEKALVRVGLEVEEITDLRGHGHRPARRRPGASRSKS